MGVNTALDRLALRARPPGSPVMEQSWENLLFLHWPVDEAMLRPLIPPELEIDLFDNSAWIGITPFNLTGLRVYPMPSLPWISSFDEVNVRTYVHYKGKPGLYFLSLDASRLIPALGARVFYQLPYFAAEIESRQLNSSYDFKMQRTLDPAVRFAARWRQGMRLRAPDTESLAVFLVERYCFYTSVAGNIYMTRAYHAPWILDEALIDSCESTLLSPHRLPEPAATPLSHFSKGVSVQIWPPVQV